MDMADVLSCVLRIRGSSRCVGRHGDPRIHPGWLGAFLGLFGHSLCLGGRSIFMFESILCSSRVLYGGYTTRST